MRDILGTHQAAEMFDLFMEYEEGVTREAILVKQLDKLDMIFQADMYFPIERTRFLTVLDMRLRKGLIYRNFLTQRTASFPTQRLRRLMMR